MLSSTQDDDSSKTFFGDVLRQIAAMPAGREGAPLDDDNNGAVFITQRDVYNGNDVYMGCRYRGKRVLRTCHLHMTQ